MTNPVSTYRIQFNKEFTFAELDSKIDYFKSLGVKTIYASPVFAATPGSMHGYDITDPHTINPEIGTEEEFRAVIKRFRNEGIGWMQDIVPNHMAFHSRNMFLMDVLEKGKQSLYSDIFDTGMVSEFYSPVLMVPFLEESLDDAIANNKILVVENNDSLVITYGDQMYPVNSRSYHTIFRGVDVPLAIAAFEDRLQELHHTEDATQYALQSRELRIQFTSLMNEPDSKNYIHRRLREINSSTEQLLAFCNDQFYRLCSWQETNEHINYRRFFTVNGLICLNMQSEKVFQWYHQKIKAFIDDGLFQAIRVDHIDGLYDPTEYLKRLRKLIGENTYIVVEKILEPGEKLAGNWAIQGTTGYEFLSSVTNLFTPSSAERSLTAFYSSLLKNEKSPEEKRIEKKALILKTQMPGELDNLQRFCADMDLLKGNDLNANDMREAIGVFLVLCPVYRMYGSAIPFEPSEANAINDIFFNARRRRPDLSGAFDALEKILLPSSARDKEYDSRALMFYHRCMQISGPLMAKGVEDTMMYTFNRFIGHNEVGDSPEMFSIETNEFHALMQQRHRDWPLTLNASSTHDTKRGEDSRMRLVVLADMADEWIKLVNGWMKSTDKYNPDRNDRYFIFQTLIASYSFDEDVNSYKARLGEYFTKAFREAKRLTNWTAPNEEFEVGVTELVDSLLEQESDFMISFIRFIEKVEAYGVINSLSQLILKFTCPGVPDTYQGTTAWDLSLVDPDNRRKVDSDLSTRLMEELASMQKDSNWFTALWQTRRDSKIKLWLLIELFKTRSKYAEVFESGDYVPLTLTGTYKAHAIAYARRYKHQWIVSIVPLNVPGISAYSENEIIIDWLDTAVILPPECPSTWKNIFSDERGEHKGQLLLKEILSESPVAIIALEKKEKDRKAGVLLSVASLPSSFGIGDIGMNAKSFVDLLARSNQSIWQLLPINTVSHKSDYSPYSSYSSFAGNTLLISLEDLRDLGLLDDNDLTDNMIPNGSIIKYKQVEKVKGFLLEKAWRKFTSLKDSSLLEEFKDFCKKQSEWLEDFSLYEFIRRRYSDKAWYDWPDNLKKRDSEALSEIRVSNDADLQKIKWLQFVFFRQWHSLKKHCNTRGIEIIGDLPFYVSYDSADVWSNPELFSLDESLGIKYSAGVPPDFFSSNGQLWGMPVYNWNELKTTQYSWWKRRIRANLQLFDIIRLDHFRAFANYWQVPADATTAKNGEWKDGPGFDFFDSLKEEFGSLPFIAEDLGEINADVFKLRDDLRLPGMKVLQFAFGDDSASSSYSVHHHEKNFVVYTGTHDNNTTRGWYRKDITTDDRYRINEYFGMNVTEKNIASSMIRLAYSSVANTVIIPLQDILNLNEKSRTNLPSTNDKNWLWKLDGPIPKSVELTLRNLVQLYDR